MMQFIRKLHKWVGLITGLQMCLWLISGFMMSLLDHHVVSGDSTAAVRHVVDLLPADATIIEPGSLIQRHSTGTVREIELSRHLGQWVWRVRTDARVALYDAHTGSAVEIGEAQARQIALDGYAGGGELVSAELLSEPTIEAREHDAPLWRIDFNDPQHTRYYISVDGGGIVERRTGDWRIFDLFWMLHTMDYRGRDDFNNPLVITFAFVSLWLALSGVILLFRSFRRRPENG
ncbi:MAG: PepSY domain-containing protein [Steroidobacter sp.]